METLTLQELITLVYVLRARVERVSEDDEEKIIVSILKKVAAEFTKR